MAKRKINSVNELVAFAEKYSLSLELKFGWKDEDGFIPFDYQYWGISLSSRYNVLSEIKSMISIVDLIPVSLRVHIKSIFCDSKACACYSIEMNDFSNVKLISEILEIGTNIKGIGHNGITISNASATADVDPYWPGDELMYAQLAS